MTYFLSFLFADPSVGKIDKHSLSQQTLMELLIEGITNRERICGSQETPKDISEWIGLNFNDSNEVIDIGWSHMGLQGEIDLKWLPVSVRWVGLGANRLTGSVDLTCLPDGLESLSLANNCLEGAIDLTKLPAGMKRIAFGGNYFTESTDLSELPQSLRVLSSENGARRGNQ